VRSLASKARSYVPPPNTTSSLWAGKKILVLVNPFGGTTRGEEIWKEVVFPMLKTCNIDFTYTITLSRGHAFNVASKLSLEKDQHAAILCISGDGIIHEIINGLASQAKHKDASGIDYEYLKKLFKRFPIAIIPAGTSNGLASTFGGTDPFVAMKRFIEGQIHQVDVCEAITTEDKHIWEVNAVYWGLAADHDYLVERPLRFLGPLREIIAPIFIFTRKKLYKGRFTFLPKETTAQEKDKFNYLDVNTLKDCPSKPGWKVLEGEFLLLTAMNVTHAAQHINFAPGCKNSGGEVDILYITDMPQWQCIKLFMGLEKGTAHIWDKDMHVVKAREFTIETSRMPAQKLGNLMASGEMIQSDSVRVKVHDGICNFVF